MHAKFAASAAVLGLSAIAAARPAPAPSSSSASHTFTPLVASSTHSSTSSAARSTATSAFQYTPGSKQLKDGQEAFNFPLADGFPSVSSSELNIIQEEAHGTLPNASVPADLVVKPDAIVSNAFVLFNELFEVAFFEELVFNISNNKPGYQPKDIPGDRDQVLATLKIHLAQEELHVLNAKKVVDAKGSEVSKHGIQPCSYIFPVSTFKESIALANLFTDVVESTLPDIIVLLGLVGDAPLTRGVGAVLGQEGEQNGFYRGLLGMPNAQLPFKTQGARDFPFNAILQNFVVPGSCGNLDILIAPGAGAKALKQYAVLNLETPNSKLSINADSQIKFTTPLSSSNNEPTAHSFIQTSGSSSGFYITYLNQANAPVSVPATIGSASGNSLAFEITAEFPGKSHFLNGLTIAALTKGNNFASPDDVAAATVAGPAFIELN
jgi:hypothetical protein